MSRITLDPSALAQLDQLTETVEVCDSSGRVVGLFSPLIEKASIQPRGRSPISREELERRRRDPANQHGKTTTELLQDLERLASR